MMGLHEKSSRPGAEAKREKSKTRPLVSAHVQFSPLLRVETSSVFFQERYLHGEAEKRGKVNQTREMDQKSSAAVPPRLGVKTPSSLSLGFVHAC